jgi:hypothetical protein
MLYDSVINESGHVGHGVACDMVVEHYNAQLKDLANGHEDFKQLQNKSRCVQTLIEIHDMLSMSVESWYSVLGVCI